MRTKKSYFSTKTYVVGTEKNRLNEHPEYMLTLMGKKIFTILCSKFCLSTDHAELFPKDSEGKKKLCDGREGEWALTVAEHLLSKLAVYDNYVMAKCYSDLPPDSLHKLTGKIGDTSFGM